LSTISNDGSCCLWDVAEYSSEAAASSPGEAEAEAEEPKSKQELVKDEVQHLIQEDKTRTRALTVIEPKQPLTYAIPWKCPTREDEDEDVRGGRAVLESIYTKEEHESALAAHLRWDEMLALTLVPAQGESIQV